MVLVAPRPLQRSASPGGSGGPGGPVAAPGGGELLALLRGEASRRPHFDPDLAGGLRAWLEDAAYGVVASRGDLGPPLVLGPREVLPADGGAVDGGVGGGGGVDGGAAESRQGQISGLVRPTERRPLADEWSQEALLDRLVHTLFRQLVMGSALSDPWRDALEGLATDGPAELVRRCETLPEPARAALAERVGTHARHLAEVLPRFAPGWMPRTDDRVAIPLAGGRVVLHGTFDLLVGPPRRGDASLCALGVATAGPWAWERRSLHFLALLETLRSGTPPFRLALVESATGRYGVEDVREDHLRAIASHLTAWLATASELSAASADA